MTATLTLVCEDLAAGAAFFRDVLALPVRQRGSGCGQVQVDLGSVTATLTGPSDLTAGSGPATMLQVEVPDVREAVRGLYRRGANVLIEPVRTEWGTESAFVAGPDGIVVELYQTR